MSRTALLRSLALLTILAAPLRAQPSGTTLFRGVRVFDGTRMLDAQDVLVDNGRIARLGRNIGAPAGAQVVDGSGKTLMPGLIDAHTHTWGDALHTALVFGITTELDMFTETGSARQLRADQAAGKANDRADIFSAGTLVTAPKGHGTEYGMSIPTIDSPDSAQSFVDARIAEGSDYIKIVYDDGRAYGMKIPTLSKETMRAVVAAAHKRDKLAVVHIGDLAGARDAIDVGADGLVHLFVDKDPDPGFGAFVAAHKAFVVPTLTVLMSVSGTAGGGPLTNDARLTPYLTKADRATLTQAFPPRAGSPPRSYAAAESTVRQLQSAKVPLLAGTDAGNPGTSHGAALHRELELLVKAGLTPAEALASATSTPARLFKLGDRGRIAAGLRADLVLVTGDPSSDITTTRAIEGVWKGGVRADRDAFAKAVAAANEGSASAPKGSESGLVSDFESGSPATAFGSGWSLSTDQMAGGKSVAQLNVVDGGANGSAKSFAITGTVAEGLPYAWSGALFSPGERMMAAVNLSSKKEVTFWAKGDGKTYRVMIFSEKGGYQPAVQSFVAGPEWKEIIMPLSAFNTDGRDIMGLVLAAGPAPGTFSLQVDDVRFR